MNKKEIRSLDMEVKAPELKVEKESLEETKVCFRDWIKRQLKHEYFEALERMIYYKQLADRDENPVHKERYEEMKKRLEISTQEEKLFSINFDRFDWFQ
jgi:hypothetical protein